MEKKRFKEVIIFLIIKGFFSGNMTTKTRKNEKGETEYEKFGIDMFAPPEKKDDKKDDKNNDDADKLV